MPWTWISENLPVASTALVLSTVFSFYSAVAVWAGLSGRHWFVRAAVVVAALLLLLPPRTYEPAVLFMAHAGVVIASLAAIRFVQPRRSGDEEGRRLGIRLRFRLADMLLAIIIIGAMTAIGAHVFRQPLLFDTLDIPLTSLSTAASTLAAAWLVLGRSRLLVRLIVFALVVAAGGICWYWYDWTSLGIFLTTDEDKMAAVLSCVCSLVFLVWLLLWRLAGFLAKWRGPSAALSTPRWARRLSQVTIVLLVPTIFVAILFIYRELARPLPPKEAITAKPNGYDDLLQAADRLSNVLVPFADETPPASAAAFVARHQAALKQIRTGLSRECQVPLSYTFDYPSADYGKVRQLARALDLEAEVATNEGRMADTARIGVDCMRLGNEISRGGLKIHWLVGNSMESYGFHRIAEVRHSLSADECREAVNAIDVIDSEREALGAIQQREHAWSQHVFGWRYTLARAVCAPVRAAYETDLTWIGVRNEARTRLLQTDLAIRAFQLEHNRYPDRLDELVPSLLRKIPVDPYCDKPLVYRREGKEYLLYSAGPNGVDDGGQRVSWEQYIEGKGDLFLDILTESR